MSFPSNPVNNQVATVNNINYTYSSTLGVWSRASNTPLLSETVNSITANVVIDSGNRVLSTSSGAGNLTISGPSVTLALTGPGAVTVGGSTSIPVITTDAYGRISTLTSSSISTTVNLAGTSGTGSVANGGTLTFAGSNGVTATASSSTITVGIPQAIATTSTPTFAGLTVNGTVSATTFSGAGTSLTGTASSLSIGGSAPAGSLTGSALASGVTASSLTSVGTLTGLTSSGLVTSTYNAGSSGNLNSGFIHSPASGASYITANRASSSTGEVGFQMQTGGAIQWLMFSPTSSTDCRWYNGSSTVMTLTSGGALTTAGLISASTAGFQSATYTAGARNRIWSFGNADGYGIAYFQGTAGFSSLDTIGFHFGTATAAASAFQFVSNGNMYATGDIYSAYSDIRLKKIVGYIEEPIALLRQIETFYYEPNEEAIALGATPGRRVGVSAQSVKKVQPEAVGQSTLGKDYLTVQYERLVPLLIETVKKQQDQIDFLVQEIDKLKGSN
jgi:hypothetical protein